jgi:hypothetical protein
MGFRDIFRWRRSSGDGSSQEQAVIIKEKSSLTGIPAEYAWLEKRFGKRDQDWEVSMRMHGGSPDGKSYETFSIKLADGSLTAIVFDISSFYGKL